jgi:hypothetical protein
MYLQTCRQSLGTGHSTRATSSTVARVPDSTPSTVVVMTADAYRHMARSGRTQQGRGATLAMMRFVRAAETRDSVRDARLRLSA